MERIPAWVSVLLAAGAVLAVVALFAALGGVVQLVLVAALLAYLLDPLVGWLEARGLSRTQATAAVFAGITLVLGGLLFLLLPVAAAQVAAIREGVDLEALARATDAVEGWLEHNLAFLGLQDLDLMARLQRFANEHAFDALNYVPGALSLVGNLVLVPFILFFLLRDGRALKKGFVGSVPNRYFEFTLNVLHKMDLQLGNYLRGQFLNATIVGLLATFVLWLLGVDYFVLIGAFAGLANMVPYVGPIAGATLAALTSVMTRGTFEQVIPIALAFTVIQMIDNTLLQPLVLSRNVKLHPLLVLLAIIAGGKLFGVVGLFLAVPAAAILKVVVQEVAVNLRRFHLA
jgi:putative permease